MPEILEEQSHKHFKKSLLFSSFKFCCKQIQGAKVLLIPLSGQIHLDPVTEFQPQSSATQPQQNKLLQQTEKRQKLKRQDRVKKTTQCSLFCLRPMSTSSSPLADRDCCSSRS